MKFVRGCLVMVVVAMGGCGEQPLTRRSIKPFTSNSHLVHGGEREGQQRSEEMVRGRSVSPARSSGLDHGTLPDADVTQNITRSYRQETVQDACEDPANQVLKAGGQTFRLQKVSTVLVAKEHSMGWLGVYHVQPHLNALGVLGLHKSVIIAGKQYGHAPRDIVLDKQSQLVKLTFRERPSPGRRVSMAVTIAQAHAIDAPVVEGLFAGRDFSAPVLKQKGYLHVLDLSVYGGCLGVYYTDDGATYSGGHPFLLLPTFQGIAQFSPRS